MPEDPAKMHVGDPDDRRNARPYDIEFNVTYLGGCLDQLQGAHVGLDGRHCVNLDHLCVRVGGTVLVAVTPHDFFAAERKAARNSSRDQPRTIPHEAREVVGNKRSFACEHQQVPQNKPFVGRGEPVGGPSAVCGDCVGQPGPFGAGLLPPVDHIFDAIGKFSGGCTVAGMNLGRKQPLHRVADCQH